MNDNPGNICILTRNNNINIELSKYLKNNSNQSLLLDTYNSKQPIIVFDVESTGTDVTEDEIIQNIVNANSGNRGRLLKVLEEHFTANENTKINDYHKYLAETNI